MVLEYLQTFALVQRHPDRFLYTSTKGCMWDSFGDRDDLGIASGNFSQFSIEHDHSEIVDL